MWCLVQLSAAYVLNIMVEVTGKGRASIPETLTKAQYVLDQLKVCLKSRRKKKNFMGSLKPAAIWFMPEHF